MPHALHVLALTALIAAGLPGSGAAQSGQTATPGLDDRAVNRQVDERQPPAQIRGQRPVEMVLVTSPGRVASNPAAFYGTRVSVHAPVSRSLNPHAFTLEPNSWWQFGDNLTVLVPMPAAGARLGPNEYVTVVGTVRPFVRAELERDYGWFDDLPDFNIDLTRQPVIVADMVRTTDGTLLTERSKPVSRVLIADAGDIADVPGRFYGQTVSVRAEVENVWSR